MIRFIPFLKSGPRVSVVRLQGPIGLGARGLSDATVSGLLEKAFRGRPDAVAVQINSPGGSPVQSSLIGARIRRLADEKKVPVYAFVEDVAASGGYWLAAAADEIFVDRSSIIGSIGVISAGFGAHELLERNGIERRLHTAGRSKSFMDPFQPEKEEDIVRLRRVLDGAHAHFIDHVKTRRGAKLADDPDLFAGEIWIGQQGVDVGLADALGHLVPEMKRRFGDKVSFRRFQQRRPLMQRLGAALAGDALAAIEERAAYARFGL